MERAAAVALGLCQIPLEKAKALLGCGKFQTDIKWNQLEMDSTITLMLFFINSGWHGTCILLSATHQICTSIM